MEIISERINNVFVESIVHAGQEMAKTLPFLFIAFMIMEVMEHREIKIKPTGYFVGAVAGCVPQCGFAAVAANLWAGGCISTGALISVFVSTSDEALLLLMSSPDHIKDAGYILLIKVIVAITVGYTVDRLETGKSITIIDKDNQYSRETDHDDVCCEGTPVAVITTAASHALKLVIILFIFSVAVNIMIHMTGEEVLSSILMRGTIIQPMIAAVVGLIPSCMPSVLMTQLYMEGLLSFPALFAGLTANAGIGLLITRSVPIAVILFIAALAASGASKILLWAI